MCERERVCVCVKERVCVKESVCVCVKERESVCVCVKERERQGMRFAALSVCVQLSVGPTETRPG